MLIRSHFSFVTFESEYWITSVCFTCLYSTKANFRLFSITFFITNYKTYFFRFLLFSICFPYKLRFIFWNRSLPKSVVALAPIPVFLSIQFFIHGFCLNMKTLFISTTSIPIPYPKHDNSVQVNVIFFINLITKKFLVWFIFMWQTLFYKACELWHIY